MNTVRNGLACLTLACLVALVGVGVAFAEPAPPPPTTQVKVYPCKQVGVAVDRTVTGCTGDTHPCDQGSCKASSNGYQSAVAGKCMFSPNVDPTSWCDKDQPVTDVVTVYMQTFECIDVRGTPCKCNAVTSKTDKTTVSVAGVAGSLCD